MTNFASPRGAIADSLNALTSCVWLSPLGGRASMWVVQKEVPGWGVREGTLTCGQDYDMRPNRIVLEKGPGLSNIGGNNNKEYTSQFVAAAMWDKSIVSDAGYFKWNVYMTNWWNGRLSYMEVLPVLGSITALD